MFKFDMDVPCYNNILSFCSNHCDIEMFFVKVFIRSKLAKYLNTLLSGTTRRKKLKRRDNDNDYNKIQDCSRRNWELTKVPVLLPFRRRLTTLQGLSVINECLYNSGELRALWLNCFRIESLEPYL